MEPLTPLQKAKPYHAALMARKAQRTAPLIPLNSINHTYEGINHNTTNNYIGKIGWGMEKEMLAVSPTRFVIGSSAGAGIAPALWETMPHKTWYDKGRNHELLMDRGGSAIDVNKRLHNMTKTLGSENQQEFFTLANKTMNLLD
jgi:hypothetical protein